MSDEEKKAIEYIKNCLNNEYNFKNGTRQKDKKAQNIILNLIEKQSKKIEELRNEVMEKELIIDGMKEDRRIAVEEIQEQYYVSKDKIRLKMKQEMDKGYRSSEERHLQNYAYDRLKELLEE